MTHISSLNYAVLSTAQSVCLKQLNRTDTQWVTALDCYTFTLIAKVNCLSSRDNDIQSLTEDRNLTYS